MPNASQRLSGDRGAGVSWRPLGAQVYDRWAAPAWDDNGAAETLGHVAGNAVAAPPEAC